MAKVKMWFDVAGDTTLLTPTAGIADTIGDVDIIPASDTLIRTLLWYDVRYLVPEDHTGVPRTPVPLLVDLNVTNADGSEPIFPADEKPVLRTYLDAVPTVAVGSYDGVDELQYRVWCGGTHGQPVESDGQRAGSMYVGGGSMRLSLTPVVSESSDIGFWAAQRYVVFFRAAFLHIHDDSA